MGGIARRQLFSVTVHDRQRAFPGYNYFDPYFQQNRAYLMDMDGRFVHYWDLPGMCADFSEMTPEGHVVAPIRKINPEGPKFPGFCGAVIYELDWDGNIVWQYEDEHQHHCIKRLPNGNTLILKVVETPPEIAKQVKGGIPGSEDKGRMWTDAIEEVNQAGEVVWRWLSHEHFDPAYDTICPYEERDEWAHGNNLEVFPNGDILIAFRWLHDCVIIDKQTGKFKWKWGRGHMFHPHNPSVLDNGNILIFDNGVHRHDSYLEYSRLVEVNPKTDEIEWEYTSTPITEFYSTFCGGAQRLPNGNTMTCEANMGRIFEVTADGDMVWEYQSPFFSLNEDAGADERDFGHCPWVHRSGRFPLDYVAFKDRDLDPDRHKALNALYGPDAFRVPSGKVFPSCPIPVRKGSEAAVAEEDGLLKRSVARASFEGTTFYSPSESYFGFNLITPASEKVVRLIDMAGKTVKQWGTDYLPTADCKLISSGNLLFAGKVEDGPLADFEGAGGVLRELDPDGKVAWEYRDPYLHHRAERLENGNTLVIKWIGVPGEIATKVAGGLKSEDDEPMWGDMIEEITPEGEVVWQWKAHEHLNPDEDSICELCSRREWTHATCVQALDDDKVLVNFMRTSQIVILDKKSGRIEWKWGKGKVNHQNHATGLPNGQLLVFDNGRHICGEVFGYSRPVYIDREKNEIVGGYEEDPPFSLFSCFLGNAQKLPNGCTLFTEGTRGHILEVSFRNAMVWEYYSPHFVDSDEWGRNNFIAGAYRYGLENAGLRKCLGMETKWRNWSEVAGTGKKKEEKKPAKSQADAVRDRLANLGY